MVAFMAISCTGKLTIDNQTNYKIVIPTQADSIEKFAAEQLQYYLKEMSGSNIRIVEEGKFKGENAIYIGRTSYANLLEVNFDQLEEDGYAYKPRNNKFAIVGGSKNGVLYGVYDLLESLGFRRYTSDCTYIPESNSIELPKNDVTFVPKVKYRTTSYRDVRNPEYSNWHKLSSQRNTWGLFVHTFFTLMPPDKYYKTHPEYYALRNGERLPTQLCLSNPAVLDTLVKNLRELMDKRPNMKYWSVSQADNDKACQCEKCVKLNQEYGGDKNRNSGAIIYFVNNVARAFPDKMISTLAYWYTREAPDNIKPEPNVNIMLCNIESERHRPVFETDPAFANDLKNWGAIAKDILIWDYNIQFANLISPFPNLHTIGQNMKFFTENNVNAFFMQANSQIGGEMAELRAYLIARLLWNPDADYQAIIDDFVSGYYGSAGPYMKQYIDTMRIALLESDHHLQIFGGPEDAKDTYLSSGMMHEYNRLFDEAEKAVVNDSVLLKRVKIARLPLKYAQIQISRTEIGTPISLFQYDVNDRPVANPQIKTVLNEFVEGTVRQGVRLLREREIPPEKYLEAHNRIFNKLDEMASVISYKKKIIPITMPSNKYRSLQALTDGVFGSFDAWRDPIYDNWIGYEGNHMDFILDLGEVKPIKSINIDFYDGKDTWYQVSLPKYVKYETSLDGKKFDNSFTVTNPVDPMDPETDSFPREIYIQSFEANADNCMARYIKVHAESILRCPAWHVRAGDPASMYCDEIVVK